MHFCFCSVFFICLCCENMQCVSLCCEHLQCISLFVLCCEHVQCISLFVCVVILYLFVL